jgi:hypothetical protein
MSAGIFATFSKFFLNTSKYPNGKVVCFVEDTTFMLGGIAGLECKRVKNESQRL